MGDFVLSSLFPGCLSCVCVCVCVLHCRETLFVVLFLLQIELLPQLTIYLLIRLTKNIDYFFFDWVMLKSFVNLLE